MEPISCSAYGGTHILREHTNMVHMKTTLSVDGPLFFDTRARRENNRRERALSRCSLRSREGERKASHC
jgi:hypothetical protein